MTPASCGEALARAAMALVGVPFRLHGRDPATGLDCVGVVAATFAATGQGAGFPTGYALRRRDVAGAEAVARQLGCRRVGDAPRPGDVVMYRVGACQFHFAIAVAEGQLVHAHAGLRRVICGAPPPEWRLEQVWRRDTGA